MAELAAAASVIAVIQLSSKVCSLCFEYSLAVKDAQSDITRLQREAKSLEDVLADLKRLLGDEDSAELPTSRKLLQAINHCSSCLETLIKRLEPGKREKLMNRAKFRALRWPFESKEVDKIIKELQECKQTVSLAIEVDQTALLLSIKQKVDLVRLPCVEGAAFDSYHDELDARCHPDTRVDLLSQIKKWSCDPQGKCIFWLNGMAGTGKSTISRTVAQSFADQRQLGASFFFKRGEEGRGNASRLFTTIATQLMVRLPAIIPDIKKAVDVNPTIPGKALREQFEKLILEPLFAMKPIHPPIAALIIVLDALDECDREGDIKTILYLLSRVRDVRSVCIRILVTSRPELPIRLGFKKLDENAHQHFVLHEIPRSIIDHDILAYLQEEFSTIRDNNCLLPDWPGEKTLQMLAEMASPLFIFAATTCRFIGDPRWNPEEQLAKVLTYKTTSQASKLDSTYAPVLDQLLIGLADSDKSRLIQEFRTIVGSIIILADPLPLSCLASLLGISEDRIARRLDLLHSVLSIPSSRCSPVRLLHLSFRDFLINPEKREKSLFWVNESETHQLVAMKCLDLMSKADRLKQDICNLGTPGALRTDLDRITIDDHISADLRYACRYWAYHFEGSNNRIRDLDVVHCFLQKHLLHWLEALSLMGKISESIPLIGSLQSLVSSHESNQVAEFLHDAIRFVLKNRHIIDNAPLQLYSSSINFSPEMSIVRQAFTDKISSQIKILSQVERVWNATLQTLEGHGSRSYSVAFSPDGKMIASGSAYDDCVTIWDAVTGEAMQSLKFRGSPTAVAFSHDNNVLATLYNDTGVRLWDTLTGEALQTFDSLMDPPSFFYFRQCSAITFLPNGTIVAAVISNTVPCTFTVWDPATGKVSPMFSMHSAESSAVAFSSDGGMIATAYGRSGVVTLWDTVTGRIMQTSEGHLDGIEAIAFLEDDRTLALVVGARAKTIELWNVATGELVRALHIPVRDVMGIAFSPNSKTTAIAPLEYPITLLDTAVEEVPQVLESHTNSVNAVAFSPDGKTIASASLDSTVRLWNTANGKATQTFQSHTGPVCAIAFSPDSETVASVSWHRTVRIWNTAAGKTLQTLQTLQTLESMTTHLDTSLTFSPNGEMIALADFSHDTVGLWGTATGEAVLALDRGASAIAFSPDGKTIALAYGDDTIGLWNTTTGEALQTLDDRTEGARVIYPSSKGKTMASAFTGGSIELLDTSTGEVLRALTGRDRCGRAVAFSPDGTMIGLAPPYDQTTRIWNVATGALRTVRGTQIAISNLSLSRHDDYLYTDRGRICFGSTRKSYIVVDDCWVVQGMQKTLWLPPGYRPRCWATRNGVLVMGHESGRVSIIEFCTNEDET